MDLVRNGDTERNEYGYVRVSARDQNEDRRPEGIEAAQKRGMKFGRPRSPVPDNFREIYDQWKRKRISATEAAAVCGLSRSTFYERARELEQEMKGT